MAVELATAYISLVPSARGIHRQISQELSSPLNRVASEAGTNSSKAFASRFQTGLRGATVGIAKTAGLALGGIGIALGAAGAFGLKAAGDFQQTRIAFEGILGSGEKAQTFLEKLRKFAAKTPFEFPELADASKQLLAVGFNAADVIPVMTRLGNVAATLGVGGAEINGVVRALGQMKGKGKASAEELNQISEQIPGFSAIKAIAGELGITTAQAFKQMESGAIDADTAVNAILAGMEKFPGAAGAMTRQSKTLNGVISTFKDTVRDALINGLEPLLPTLSSGIERVAPIIGKALGAASKGVADFVKGVQGAGDAGTGAIAVIGGRIRALVTGFVDFVKGNVASAGVELGKVFGLQEDDPRVIGFINALTRIRGVLASVVQFIATNWKPVLIGAGAALLLITAPVVAVAAGLLTLYARFQGVRDVVAGFANFVQGPLAEALRPLRDAIVDFAKAAVKFAKDAAPALKILAVIVGAALIVGVRVLAFVIQLLADKMTVLGPILATAAAGFVGFKVVKAVETGILGVAKAAGTAYGKLSDFADAVKAAPGKLSQFASAMKSGVTNIASFARNAVIATVNMIRQTAAFVAHKIATAASAVATGVLTAATWLLNTAMSANPIVLVVAALVALGAAVFLAYKHFGPFRAAVDAAWQILQSTFNWVRENWPLLLGILTGPIGIAVLLIVRNFDRIKGFVNTVFEFVRTKWPLLLAVLTGPFGLAVLYISRNFDSIVGFFRGLPGRILGFVKAVGTAALAVGTAIIGGIKDGLTGAVSFVTDIGKAIANAAIGFINTIIDQINDALEFKIKGPGPLPDISVNPPDIGHIGRLAHGGVVSSPMLAFIGEDRRTTPEIVSPVKLMAATFKAELDRNGRTIDIRTKVDGTGKFAALMQELFDDHDRELTATLNAGVR